MISVYTTLLFNHTTKEVLELITPSYARDSGANYFANGIGYDSFTDDYKVVTVSYCKADRGKERSVDETDSDEMFVDVYSVKNGSWKRVENCTHYYGFNSLDSGVFVDGYIHWLCTSRTSSLDYVSIIVAFDLKEEKFREMIFPSWIGSERSVACNIVSLGGCLGMYPHVIAVFTYGLDPTEFWIMKEYGVMDSWTKYELFSGGTSHYRAQCLLGKQQVVLEKHDGRGQMGVNKLVLFDLNERICKDVVVHGITDEFFVGGTSMESLVSPYPHSSTGAVSRRNLRVASRMNLLPQENLHVASRMNLVPKEPSRSSLHRLIAVMVLGVLVAKWLLDVV